jgi:hypothetical protein
MVPTFEGQKCLPCFFGPSDRAGFPFSIKHSQILTWHTRATTECGQLPSPTLFNLCKSLFDDLATSLPLSHLPLQALPHELDLVLMRPHFDLPPLWIPTAQF